MRRFQRRFLLCQESGCRAITEIEAEVPFIAACQVCNSMHVGNFWPKPWMTLEWFKEEIAAGRHPSRSNLADANLRGRWDV